MRCCAHVWKQLLHPHGTARGLFAHLQDGVHGRPTAAACVIHFCSKSFAVVCRSSAADRRPHLPFPASRPMRLLQSSVTPPLARRTCASPPLWVRASRPGACRPAQSVLNNASRAQRPTICRVTGGSSEEQAVAQDALEAALQGQLPPSEKTARLQRGSQLSPGDVLQDKYTIVDVLGSGSNATAYRATTADGRTVAIKAGNSSRVHTRMHAWPCVRQHPCRC